MKLCSECIHSIAPDDDFRNKAYEKKKYRLCDAIDDKPICLNELAIGTACGPDAKLWEKK